MLVLVASTRKASLTHVTANVICNMLLLELLLWRLTILAAIVQLAVHSM